MTEANPLAAQELLARQLTDLLTQIVRVLVDQPENVSVHSTSTASETTLHLFVSEVDLGKVIGRQGRTARSLRTILGAAGMKLQHRFLLDIAEHPPQ